MKKQYFKTYWDGIPLEFFSEERMEEAVACGFNLIQGGKVGGYRANAVKREAYDVATAQKALEICEKHGVKYMVFDVRVIDLLSGERSDEEIDSTIRAVCEDYRDYPALHSYLVKDEPDTSLFPRLRKITDAFKRHDPAHIPYINLLPNYAPPSMLGAPTYEAYVERFVEEVRPDILCYDHYHLIKDNPAADEITDVLDPFTERVYAASLSRGERSGFYNNLEIIRRNGLKADLPYMLIVLLVEHGPYRFLTRAELYFEVWQTLAYGCTALSYYNYWALPRHRCYANAIISADGDKCSHYWDVQAINRRITPVGERIVNTRSEAVFHVGDKNLKEGVTPFSPHRGIEKVTGGELTVGFFEDGTFIIANQDYTAPAEVTVTAANGVSLERFDPETDAFLPWESDTVTIPAGEGVYLRIVR